MDWIYKDNIVDNLPMNTFGFTYLLVFNYFGKWRIEKPTPLVYKYKVVDTTKLIPMLYVGRKNMYSYTKKYLGKKELALQTDKRLKNYKTVITESSWRNYTGSSKETKGKVLVSKEILNIYQDKINLTYGEVEEMIKRDVLRDDRYLNGNCLGKFFRGKIL